MHACCTAVAQSSFYARGAARRIVLIAAGRCKHQINLFPKVVWQQYVGEAGKSIIYIYIYIHVYYIHLYFTKEMVVVKTHTT